MSLQRREDTTLSQQQLVHSGDTLKGNAAIMIALWAKSRRKLMRPGQSKLVVMTSLTGEATGLSVCLMTQGESQEAISLPNIISLVKNHVRPVRPLEPSQLGLQSGPFSLHPHFLKCQLSHDGVLPPSTTTKPLHKPPCLVNTCSERYKPQTHNSRNDSREIVPNKRELV